MIARGILQAKIDTQSNTIIFERLLTEGPSVTVGTLPSNDRKEVEHLQLQHLEKIKLMVDTNERCMDLLINQNTYIQYSNKEKTAFLHANEIMNNKVL